MPQDFSRQQMQQQATSWLMRLRQQLATWLTQLQTVTATGCDQLKTIDYPAIKNINTTTAITIASSIAVIAMLMTIGSFIPVLATTTAQTQHESLAVSLPNSLITNPKRPKRLHTTIHSGDSASSALHRLGFSSRDVLAMANASKKSYPLTRIHPGQTMERLDSNGSTQLTMDLDPLRTLTITQTDKKWHSSIETRTTTSRWQILSATIHNNFFYDASHAGLSDRTIVNLAYIFGWDIDFARNLREGDHFSVLLEEQYNNQGKAITTTILAAIFVNRGKTFRAIRFTNRHGEPLYYAPDGSNMRKNFLKAPVKFTRISSRFKRSRKHPVLGYTRAHRGVDYAAPSGTPIHAVGAGKIVYFGRRGGYGRFIAIQHRNRHHETRYAHLSRYAKGLHKGSWVKQGQIIGFVGMSGLATGPHLHFEFRVNGRAINPLHIKRVPAEPLSRQLRAKFKQKSKLLLHALHLQQPTTMAWQ
ncbi:MAG: peptidoglycan DD-metalloendopeptidase family protein [Mariprofundales bacterium]